MVMYPIKVSATSDRYRQNININNKFQLTADEPLDLGGNDAGATPVELVLAGLGSCKAITLKMYAERKDWELERVDVDIKHQQVNRKYHISVRLHLTGNLTDEQKQRLREIADKCPVHKLLESAAQIETVIVE
ncbi:MAG: OsmC family protein [Cyanobacteria bacterium P01_C01_bin.72]